MDDDHAWSTLAVDATNDRSEASADARVEGLIGEHRSAVFGYAVRLTRGDAAWAEDVVQETFVRAWRRWEQMTPERGSVRGWLLRVAHNLVMDGHRTAGKRHGELLTDMISDAATPESPDHSDQILSAHMVHEALQQLPDSHRQVLAATYLLDQTAAQAARCLDIPIGTVKSRAFYGLRMLRAHLGIGAGSSAAA